MLNYRFGGKDGLCEYERFSLVAIIKCVGFVSESCSWMWINSSAGTVWCNYTEFDVKIDQRKLDAVNEVTGSTVVT